VNDLGQIVANGSDNRAYLLDAAFLHHLLVTFAARRGRGLPGEHDRHDGRFQQQHGDKLSGTVRFTSSDRGRSAAA